jgi:hypothetical protein
MLAFPDSGGKGERQEKRVSPEEKDRSTDVTVTVRINYLLGKADLMYNDLALLIGDFFRFCLSI